MNFELPGFPATNDDSQETRRTARAAGIAQLAFGLQPRSRPHATFGRVLKTSPRPFADRLVLFALGAIPLVRLGAIEMVQHESPAAAPAHASQVYP